SSLSFALQSISSTISALGAKDPGSTDQWNMLMPVREYNKHLAKIPNCKMRRPKASMWRRRLLVPLPVLQLLLLLPIVQALDPAAPGAGALGGGSSSGGGGAASAAGGGDPAGGNSGGGTLVANLTEQGSPGAYNSPDW
ncbi:hypothetical protein KR018_006019, partial [Drosophila ironensis]